MIWLYRFFLQLVWILKSLFRLIPHEKISFFFKHAGQITVRESFQTRPLWIHASSGEIEYAKSLIRELQAQYPQIPLLVTHTSLSSTKTISTLRAHAYGVSPLDTPQDVKKFLKRWNPRACLIARTDLWPETLSKLHDFNIPTFLFSATFAQGSKKISFFSRQLLKSTLPLITKIYFVSKEDEAVCRNFFPSVQGKILGDTRYDQVLFRLQQAANLNIPPYEKILIAGSTWSEDELVLIPAFDKLREQSWKFIIVPHEVHPNHIDSLKAKLSERSLKFYLYSQGIESFQWENFDVLLVDQVGILASLYPYARLAFIGGSYRRQVHSVMEALATNSPVIVGPFHTNNREALEFKSLGFVMEAQDSVQFAEITEHFGTKLNEMTPALQNEIQKRLGTTQKLIQDLEVQGLLAENAKT